MPAPTASADSLAYVALPTWARGRVRVRVRVRVDVRVRVRVGVGVRVPTSVSPGSATAGGAAQLTKSATRVPGQGQG